MEFAEKLTFEDFEKMHSLENKFYDEEFITPAEEAYEWYVKYPYSVTVAKDGEESLQKIHDKYIKRAEEIFAAKEKEIMTV